MCINGNTLLGEHPRRAFCRKEAPIRSLQRNGGQHAGLKRARVDTHLAGCGQSPERRMQ